MGDWGSLLLSAPPPPQEPKLRLTLLPTPPSHGAV